MILVAFASKSGTAKEAAEKLAARLDQAELVDLTKQTPQVAAYDAVIIGAGVRMGTLHKAVRQFLGAHATELKTKKWGLYFTNSFPDAVDAIIQASVPEDLRATAVWLGTLGGRLDIDKLTGFDKFVAKAVSGNVKEDKVVHQGLNEDALSELAAVFSAQ